MRFEELNENINTVLMTMLGSQNLCKLLYYNDNNPLSMPDLTDTGVVLFQNLFITPIVPKIEDTAKSLITVVLDDFSLGRTNTAFKTSKITFNVLIHIDLWMMLGTGKLRPYSILNEIDKLFNQQRILGIGKLEFSNARWMGISDAWQGYQVNYKVVGFN